MKKILVVNVNWAGDAVFSSAVFQSLRQQYPDAHITCMAVPRVEEILKSIPEIDHIIVYDEKGRDRNPLAKCGLVFRLRREKFDCVFLLHRSATRAFMMRAAGIPQRVGYAKEGRNRWLTHVAQEPPQPKHRADIYLNILESFGVPASHREAKLVVDEVAEKEVDELLMNHQIKDNDRIIVIHPGGNWDLKRWPKGNFGKLINQLNSDAKVIISGGQDDVSLAEEISELAAADRKPVIVAGQTNMKQLIALLGRADVVISADSGPLHIANSVGTAVIGIYGPTRPEVTGPKGSGPSVILQNDVGCNRHPCYYLECPDNICMQSVSVEQVIDAVREIKNQ